MNSIEEKAIMEQNAEKQSKSVAGMVLSTTNLANQIPENERAIEVSETKVTPSVIRVLDNLALSVPEDEKAEAGEADEFESVRGLGCFNPSVGMANISGALSNKIYARNYVAPDGTRYIQFCERYSDGRFSSKMMVAQSNMLLAARYNFMVKNIPMPALKNKITKFILAVTEEYLGKYSGPDEVLDIVDILKVLLEVRISLPVFNDAPKELESEQFYHQVIQIIEDERLYHLDDHKAYYTLDDDQIIFLEKKLGMKRNTLLPKLKSHGFLYLTESCKGYQTNVRFKAAGNGKSFTAWVYCIYKLQYFAKKKETETTEEK